uniref:Uncharacterized protein n=1 Tax=Chlamydomonas leiostraca TaxID=1034604 RepID=A0A7S0R2P2_9CHLO|mmetsp:Transcript_12358/g.30305  ORF Transcript_12358/g.30305 Transcript_12358/m.30305 type:complete len:192 (+) Transcript_12358:61-636(+)|eukprot:CAMPEP_0202865090 /NCGR_PEP_ID=MMETSP1391-20130828/5233_1 /ASSEMBLY_ACC=CAM_ASM_000867 /TAXON_ID=1034604 /ORGANISM="Chlamydomonas leiostraca, Strain SAG 11-49" /LENGTH=191 /DNA_ID=CAMNT_0049544887 /DNA_START=61 /DNA_END=636 /DNA_ORIENTATION=+
MICNLSANARIVNGNGHNVASRNMRISRVPVVRCMAQQQSSDNPVRQVLAGVVSGIYKASAAVSVPEPGLSPLWAAIKRLDTAGLKTHMQRGGVDLNERNANGDTPLLFIAREGHYKYPPQDLPAALIKAGADLEAKDRQGLTALQVSLLAGWQNIAELLINSGASTSGVTAIKGRLTCPDCKRLVAKYNL